MDRFSHGRSIRRSARIQDHPRSLVDHRLGGGRPGKISDMTALEEELTRLQRVAFQLNDVLTTKTTKLPPAAIEDLRIALREALNRLVGQVDKFLAGEFDRDVALLASHANDASNASIYEQFTVLRVIANFLAGVISKQKHRASRRQINDLLSVLRGIDHELEGYLEQLQERRLYRDYLWLAENAVAPYSVRGLIPLKESGLLVLADSPGLSFETAAPHSGLGESPADIAVDVYLDTSDSEVIDDVMSRVDDLIEVMGYRQVGDIEVERGSIFRRSRAAADQVTDELKSRLMKVERAFELAQLELRQADVDIREADAVNKLLASLENVPRACLRVGSVLVIKYPHPAADEPVVIVRNLSQLELHVLSRFPEIQRFPETALQALTMTLENVSREYNQLTDSDPGYAPPAT